MSWILAYGFLLSMLTVKSQGSTCRSPSLYFTKERGIWCIEIKDRSPRVAKNVIYMPPHKGGFAYTNRPITIDVKREKIYWQSFFRKEIYQANMDGSNQTAIISGFTGVIAGLAIDWITGNIYFTDSLHSWIGVSYYDKTTGVGYKKILISDGLSRPTGIAVDPIKGYLFWVDPSRRRLERSLLDGSDRKVLVTRGLVYPADLTIDIEKGTLFWCDVYFRRVCWSDYDGNGRACYTFSYVLFHNYRSLSLYSVAFHQASQSVFVTDVQEEIIERYDAKNRREQRYLHTSYTNILSRYYSQVRVFDAAAQPPGSTPCNVSKPCSHFCFKLSNTTYKCGCPMGMMLNPNGRSCRKLPTNFNMYFADYYVGKLFHMTQYANHSGTRLEVVPNSGSDSAYPVGLVYDAKKDFLYWSDIGAKKIFRMHSNGTALKTIADRDVDRVEGIALDHKFGLLFWTNRMKNAIEVSKLDGSHRHLVLDSDIDRPLDIVLYVERGQMFISDWGARPRVIQMNLDGTNRKALAGVGTNITVRRPHGLTLDKIENKLYYVDSYLDKIMAYDLDTGLTKVILYHGSKTPLNRTYIVFRVADKLEHPFSLTLFGNYLYWSDWATGAVYRANRFEGGKIELVAGGLFRPADLHSFPARSLIRHKRKFIFTYADTPCASQCNISKINALTLPACPPGYRLQRQLSKCHACNSKVTYASGRKCECKDWASCVHRIEATSPCTDDKPLLHVGVTECIQDIKPGYCPMIAFLHCPNITDACTADNDCQGSKKCCSTSCGNMCLMTIEHPALPSPCETRYKKCNICIPLPNNKHKCLCPPGQVLDKDGITCKHAQGVCENYGPCKNGGRCVAVGAKPKCTCTASYTGSYCETSLYCHTKPCGPGTCKEVPGGYVCRCPLHVTGRNCDKVRNCDTNICQNNGTCYIAVDGSKKCNCTVEFAGAMCEFKKPCLSNPCKNGGDCVDEFLESPKCICPSNYAGPLCEIPRVCLGVRCENNGTCHPLGRRSECRCVPGYTGTRCETKLHCFNADCKNGARCVERNNGYKCNCSLGYTGEHCDQTTPCVGKTCNHKGRCEVQQSGYKCNCEVGYTGRNCETHLQCKDGDCKNGGKCIDLGTDFKCSCTAGYTGKTCDQRIPCYDKTCSNKGKCMPQGTGYKCTCIPDYTGNDCEKKIDNCIGNRCANGATCVDEVGSYSCQCATGYTGQFCDVKPFCTGCLNGGVCDASNPSVCRCPEYYADTRCQLYTKNNVLVTFLRPKEGASISRAKFQSVLARGYTAVCTTTLSCFDLNTVNRKRRESPPFNLTFADGDILVNEKYPALQTDKTVKFEFTVMKPESLTRNRGRELLALSVIKSGFEKLKDFIEKELGVTVVTYQALQSPQTGSRKPKKKGVSVGTGLAIAAVVIIVAVLLHFLRIYWKRRRSKEQSTAPPVSFSNKTFAPDVHPPLHDYSQDPRGLPIDAPPEYDGPGFNPQLPVYNANGLSYMENPTYGGAGAEMPSAKIGDPYEIATLQKDEKLRVDMSSFDTNVTLRPELTNEATGFENPLYSQTHHDNYQNMVISKEKEAPVGIYQTLTNENDEDDQAGPLPEKKPPPDINDSTA